jgi:hypothetical protein
MARKRYSSEQIIGMLREASFFWNQPFDLLHDLFLKSEVRGGLIHELRTFLRQISIAPLIQQLSQLAA